MENETLITAIVTTAVNTLVGLIARAIEKRKLRGKGKLIDKIIKASEEKN